MEKNTKSYVAGLDAGREGRDLLGLGGHERLVVLDGSLARY